MSRFRLIFVLFIFAWFIGGCQNNPTEPPGGTPQAAPIVSQVKPVGLPQPRELQTTVQVVRNCGGLADLTRHPTISVVTSHSVQWQMGTSVGVGMKVGGGVLPGEVDLTGSFSTAAVVGGETAKQISDSWDLTAPPNTAMEFTMRWWEDWQTGNILLTLPSSGTYTVTVDYRVGINSDMVSQRQLPCGTPTPVNPALNFHVYEDFSSANLDLNFGVGEGMDAPTIKNGFLDMDYSTAKDWGSNSIYIKNSTNQIQNFAGSVVLDSSRGEGYTYLQIQLGIIDAQGWYANFGLDNSGGIFLAVAPDGSSPQKILKWPGKPVGVINDLVIDYSGGAWNFFANGEYLHTIQAENGGHWAMIGVGTIGNSSMNSRWDWVGWSYR